MRILMAYTGGFTPEMYEQFRALGLELVFLPGPEGRPGRETDCYDTVDFSDIDAVVCYLFFSHNPISRFPRLKYIHTTSSGVDHLPLDYIRAHGIRLCNARGVYSVPMAEFALCGVLQLYKAAAGFRVQQSAHVWRRNWHLRELPGKQLTILGAGSIGTACAQRFSAMGCRVVGLCRHPDPGAEYYDDQVHIDRLDALLPHSDILQISLPLSDDTRGLLDRRRLGLLKPGAVLVNLARGPIVDTSALTEALACGSLSGAVLDVFDTEPLPPDSPLWDMETSIVTPHNSFVGEGNAQRMFHLIYDDTANWLKEETR